MAGQGHGVPEGSKNLLSTLIILNLPICEGFNCEGSTIIFLSLR